MTDRIEFIELDALRFDPLNPRLPVRYRNKSEKEVIEWMLTDASLLDLAVSIGQNGFFSGEPLLAIKEGKFFTVIEGNRRLAAAKLLSTPGITKTKKQSISEILEESPKENIPSLLPVVIFNSRNDIIDYLGYRHITGVESWGPLAKARYLNQLHSNISAKLPEGEKYKILAKKIGSKADYVRNLLIGYQLYEKLENEGFFKIDNLNEETIEFSHLYDSVKHSGITKFLGIDAQSSKPLKNLNKENLEEFATWLYQKEQGITRLGESRNLRVLDKVLESPRAMKMFREGKSLTEASYFSKHTEEVFTESILEALKNINIAREFSTKMEEFNDSDTDNLKEIAKATKMIISYIQNLEF